MNTQTNNRKAEDNDIDLVQVLLDLWSKKFILLFFILLLTLLSFIYAYGKTPIYQADVLLQVETKKAVIPGIVKSTISGEDTTVGTELEILKSRKNLGKAVDALKLDILATPKRLPILGLFYKQLFNSNEIKKPPLLWKKLEKFAEKYAWGNEVISIESLEVPKQYINQPLTLIALEDGLFKVITKDDSVLLSEGEVGKTSYSENKAFKIFVSELKALPKTEFLIVKNSKLKAISDLANKIKASEKGKLTGIILMVLEGSDKKKIVSILNHISRTYLEQNRSRSSQEATSALEFLQKQLIPVRAKLEQYEASLKKYRIDNQTADLSLETKAVLDVVTRIDTQLQSLALKKEELGQKYTQNHPTIQAVLSQERKLLRNKQKALKKVSKLPGKQQKLLKLEGDFKVTNTIYNEILNDIQEYKIAQASSLGNVYIVDSAVAQDKAVKPKKSLLIIIGSILGLILGLFIIHIRKVLHKTVDNPEQLEKSIGTPVYATVPLSKGVKNTGGLKIKKQKSLLAIKNMNDPAIESLRSLRTSLHFASLEAKNNIVMITGPSPNTGKSFITSNFAAVVASGDKRVLLIDADMRKGYLHDTLNVNGIPGLSDLISAKNTIEEVIQTINIEDSTLDVITRGQIPPNPSELLMHPNFEKLLNKLSSMYDLILIDTPPVHAVTDPAIVGSHAGVVFMVVKSEHHTMDEVEQAVKRLKNVGIETKGFIFNGYVPKKSGYSYNYYSYEYYSD